MTVQEISLILKTAGIWVVPVTVAIFMYFLRPLLQSLTRLEVGGFEIALRDRIGDTGGLETESPNAGNFRLPRSLTEESKEKLEKLRLALETEQVNQSIKYHTNSLQQSRVSFWFSIGAGTLGFLIIVLGMMLALLGFQLNTAALSVASGSIIDAVAALFFTHSNQARRLMTEFFDKLRSDRQFNESLRLCDSIKDDTIQSNLKARLSLFFAGIPASELTRAEQSLSPQVPLKEEPSEVIRETGSGAR